MESKRESCNNERGAAIIVTYNRKDKLKKCIECLLKQTYTLDKIYIVNNASTDGTEDYLQEISKKNAQVEYQTTEENLGGAGGFCRAIKWAYEEGADWIWGMDDDAFPKEDALYNLQEVRLRNSKNDAYWSNPNKDKEFDGELKAVQKWMFVGFFLTKEIIEKVGFPREDFFIYFDDLEYAKRIINNGYNIWKVKNSIIDHQDAVSKVKEIKIGRKNIIVTCLPEQKWKTYYLVRNEILLFKNDDNYRNVIYRDIRRIVKAVFFHSDQIGSVIKGFYHGLIGKTGKIMIP